jgi:DNA-binding transcriptional ArsR family regulator/uncharacterized protein YndB with AHSA1/START domain
MNESHMNNDDLTPVWKALSDPTRRKILDLLKERPRTTGDLCDSFLVSRFAVMKHLAVLENAELIVVRRRGRERWNHLNAVPLQRIYERWLRPYEGQWASALLQLKHQVEASKGSSTTMAEKSIVAATMKDIHIEQNIAIKASPEVVFDALTGEISAWWTAPYFHTGETRQLVLEALVGGRFYEDLGNNEGLLLATVMLVRRPDELRLMGPMGLAGVVHGVISFDLEAQDGGTRLKLSHRMVGEVSDEIESAFSGGWQELLGTRLCSFVEHGTRYDGGPDSLPDGSN